MCLVSAATSMCMPSDISVNHPRPQTFSEYTSMSSFSDYDIFSRVARTGNMSAAGREMGLSPAVVSKRVSLLEERLGVRLFQRTTRQLTLTETGDGFARRVNDILTLVEEAEDFVKRRNIKPSGVLRITAPTTFSRMHVAPHLPDFLNQFPEVQLDFHISDTNVDIIGEGFDIAIRTGELKDSSLVAKKLASDQRVLVAAKSYIKKQGAPKSLAELEFHNCLAASQQETWRLVGPNGPESFKPKGDIRSDSNAFLRDLLLSGVGIGMRSKWEIANELEKGELEIVLPDYKSSDNLGIYAVYPCRDFMPAKTQKFIDYLSGIYSGEPYWNHNVKVA